MPELHTRAGVQIAVGVIGFAHFRPKWEGALEARNPLANALPAQFVAGEWWPRLESNQRHAV
jgi:hypothetical protein